MPEVVTLEPPQDRAVTLEEARQQLRLDAHDEDLLLGAKLDAAQAELEAQTGLKLCQQTLELQLESSARQARFSRERNIEWKLSRRLRRPFALREEQQP